MKRLYAILPILLLSAAVPQAMAQQPEGATVQGGVVLADDEQGSNVAAILERYYDLAPDLERSLMIRSWMPHQRVMLLQPLGVKEHLWEQSAIVPSIALPPPSAVDRSTLRLRVGSSGSATITISNGSAYNYMPWQNYPGAYRDARTLSFPLPR